MTEYAAGDWDANTGFIGIWESDGTDNDEEQDGKTKKGFTPNYPPVADASAGEPYIGFIQEHITLNGTKSYDPDGKIVVWSWDFGDGTTGEGELSIHSYSNPDTYRVILTVKDNRGATDSDETQVVVSQPNRPPLAPTVDGPPLGIVNISYNFTARSVDLDNDSVSYIVDWGDKTSTTTDFLANGTLAIINHTWLSAGEYLVVVQAYDDEVYSQTTKVRILINDTEQLVNADVVHEETYTNLILIIIMLIEILSFLVFIQKSKIK